MGLEILSTIGILGAVGFVVAFYQQIKSTIVRVSQFVIRTDSVYAFCEEITAEFLKDAKVIRYGNMRANSCYGFEKDTGNFVNFLFRQDSKLLLLYKRVIPMILTVEDQGIKITYIQGTINLEKVLSSVVVSKARPFNNFRIDDLFGETKEKHRSNDMVAEAPESSMRYFRYSVLGKHAKMYGKNINNVSWDNPLIKSPAYFWSIESIRLLKDIEFWHESKSWFLNKNLPWKRASLLYGKPGTGKSKAVVEIAKRLKVPIKRLNIGTMSSEEFIEFFNNQPKDGCIVLIEDIDSVFHGRKNLLADKCLNKQLLSFDVLINTISGIKSNEARCYVVITTNYVDKVDDALKRAGRLDTHIEFGGISKEGKLQIASNLFSDWPELITKLVEEDEDVSVAEFESKCVELAVTQYWKERAINE